MWGFILVKDLAFAKQRLSAALTPEERAGLVEAMAMDVFEAASSYQGLDRLVVCSPDSRIERLAAQWRLEFLPEGELPERGNVNSVANGLARLLCRQGAPDVLFIPADLPLLASGDLVDCSDTYRRLERPSAVLAPDCHGTGTNLVAWQPQSGFSVSFGPGSLVRHRANAARLGVNVALCERRGAMFDIDEPADLIALLREPREGSARFTKRYLRASGLPQRLLSCDTAHWVP